MKKIFIQIILIHCLKNFNTKLIICYFLYAPAVQGVKYTKTNKIYVRGNLLSALAIQNLTFFLVCVQGLFFIIWVEGQELLPSQEPEVRDTHIPVILPGQE